MELILENVRCFAGRHEFTIKPLTILMGENSTGKSTLLAALATVSDPIGFPWQPQFNEPPYNLGNFDTIATKRGGRTGQAETFSMGFRQQGKDRTGTKELVATYVNRRGSAELSDLFVRNEEIEFHLLVPKSEPGAAAHVQIRYAGEDWSTSVPFERVIVQAGYRRSIDPLFMYLQHATRGGNLDMSRRQPLLYALLGLFGSPLPPTPTSIAPIRTRPTRIYDPAAEQITPEGDHIPFVLRRHLTEAGAPAQPESLKSAIERFGQEAGLFRRLDVRNLGAKESDPFQILVTDAGKPAALLDVGYGVSQALPVVVQSLLASHDQLLLMQQPEVHLHPRAQAALGSLFARLAAEGGREFVIETHSDYIVDRIRQEVGAGRLDPASVSLLYLERRGVETTVYPISLDRGGNVVDAPGSYREFFLREELNLLTRTA